MRERECPQRWPSAYGVGLLCEIKLPRPLRSPEKCRLCPLIAMPPRPVTEAGTCGLSPVTEL